jgi:hypothetical protein
MVSGVIFPLAWEIQRAMRERGLGRMPTPGSNQLVTNKRIDNGLCRCADRTLSDSIQFSFIDQKGTNTRILQP